MNIMLAPFVECLILVGLHAYLGIHVLKRHVIFVDLSLAQIAALGTSVGILFGIYDTESIASFLFAISFTLIGAGIFAMTRIRDERVPQEAVIGLVYAITAALAVLVVQRTKGVEHLVNIMHGRLLWVQWSEIMEAAIIYTIIASIHFIFRRQFLLISENPDEAYNQGMRVRLWDFFFYVTFGLTISTSVKVAGVLLVFVFLVAPAIIAFLLTDRLRWQLAIGWAAGTIVTTAGLGVSWMADLPSGPTVVTFYGIVLIAVALGVYLFRAPKRLTAAGHILGGFVVLLALAKLFAFGGHLLVDTSLAGNSLEHGHGHEAAEAHEHGQTSDTDQHDAAHQHDATGGDVTGETDAAAAPAPQGAIARYKQSETCIDRVDVLDETLKVERIQGLELLHLFFMDGETSPFCRSMALELVKAQANQDFGIDPDVAPVDNLTALEALEQWVHQQSKDEP